MIAGSTIFFPRIHIKYVFVYVTMAPHYKDFDLKLTSEAKIQPVFLKVQAEKTLSYHGHALVTFYVQFLYSDWSKFDR